MSFFCRIIFAYLIISYYTPLSLGQSRLSLPFSSSYDEDAALLMGIHYSYSFSNYILSLEENWKGTDITDQNSATQNINDVYNLSAITSRPSAGVNVGIPVDIRFTDNLYLTFIPSFTFINHSKISYKGEDEIENIIINERRTRHDSKTTNGTNFNSFSFPLNIKFRSDEKVLKNKFNRYRAYLSGGARYTRWIGINSEYNELIPLKLTGLAPKAIIMKPGYYSWEVGVGLDIFFTYFKMSPEIKFNQSFGNVLDKDHALAHDNGFMSPLNKASARNIFLTIIFQ